MLVLLADNADDTAMYAGVFFPLMLFKLMLFPLMLLMLMLFPR